MSSYAIMVGEKRVGTVMSFAGNPKATRWVGYASKDRRQGFPTMRAAMHWVRDLTDADERETSSPDPARSGPNAPDCKSSNA